MVKYCKTLSFVAVLLFVHSIVESTEAPGVTDMTTENTVNGYFQSLKEKKGWESFLSEDIVFTSFTSPVKQIAGKAAYLEATKRFYSSIVSFEVIDRIVSGEKACVLTRYQLQSPTGNTFTSDVAEIFKVKDGKINSFGIYFDSAPFPK
jgi:ketosteroid isomerase-like protein